MKNSEYFESCVTYAEFPFRLSQWAHFRKRISSKIQERSEEKILFSNFQTLIRNEKHKTIFKILLVKSSENFIFLPAFNLIMCFKEFWQNNHFENMRAGFL